MAEWETGKRGSSGGNCDMEATPDHARQHQATPPGHETVASPGVMAIQSTALTVTGWNVANVGAQSAVGWGGEKGQEQCC